MMNNGVCKEPTGFYLLAVALRSFFLVLATHLLAGEVDTSLAGVPLTRKLAWWCRYYNPLNLSWRYYSMFAYRFTAHSWGSPQLALINHEEHPLLPPLPYIIGETVHPLQVRRLEMAGLLSSQGILTFSAAYQGALAIQYAISTEGIPYLPNTTVPLAMVGLFRVMACKWVASKIHVDAYPYPCMPSTSSSKVCKPESNARASLLRFLQLCKSSIGSLWAFSPTATTTKDSSSTPPPMITSKRDPLSTSLPVTKLQIEQSSSTFLAVPPSVLQSPNRPLLPTISRPYSMLSLSPHVRESASVNVSTCNTGVLSLTSLRTYIPSLSKARLLPSSCSPSEEHHPNTFIYSSAASSSLCTNLPSISCSKLEASTHACPHALNSPLSLSDEPSQGYQMHAHASPEKPLPHNSNKIVVGVWIGVLFGLVTMSFLPYKVAAAYQLPNRLLQFSMQIFYQYIAVSEFFFHGYLLYQGPRALANRVLFFDHWAFKAQTAGFFCLLIFMLVIALLDFVKHEFYRTCA